MTTPRFPMKLLETAIKQAKSEKVTVYIINYGGIFTMSTRGQPSKYRQHWRITPDGKLGTWNVPERVTDKTKIVYK